MKYILRTACGCEGEDSVAFVQFQVGSSCATILGTTVLDMIESGCRDGVYNLPDLVYNDLINIHSPQNKTNRAVIP